MSLFTACSDDDDNTNWKKLPSQAITAENLSLETNIPASSGASVKLAMANAQNGVLTLNKVVKGTDAVEVDVTVTEQPDGTFKFQGEKSISSTTKAAWQLLSSTNVRVSGTITLEGKATVTVSTEASGDIVKKYLLCDAIRYEDSEDRTNVYAPGRLSWVSPYGEGDNAGLAADNIATVGTNILSALMMQLLKDVEFKADGSIVANYAEEINISMDQMIMAGMGTLPSTDGISWKTSPANLAYWYVKGEQIYVVLNIPAIVTEAMKDAEGSNLTPESIMGIVEMVKGMSGADIKKLLGQVLAEFGKDNMLSKLDLSKIPDSDIEKLIGYLTEGFPLSYKTSQLEIKKGEEVVRTVNNLSIYLDKNLFDIFMPAIYPILPDLDTLLKGMEIEMYGQKMPLWNMIQMLTGLNSITEVEGIWKATTKFNLGINLGNGSYKDAE
ncbi:DUF4925 domain-containing protein [Bacteroides sp.]|uniref:DUF4925 domain-containing protein n=1 Tax=Bacteroides sp. TaxID=29523 RepID=UPI00260629A2|nr:DUF4925 domain-containing protein [Bacteroides sp.]